MNERPTHIDLFKPKSMTHRETRSFQPLPFLGQIPQEPYGGVYVRRLSRLVGFLGNYQSCFRSDGGRVHCGEFCDRFFSQRQVCAHRSKGELFASQRDKEVCSRAGQSKRRRANSGDLFLLGDLVLTGHNPKAPYDIAGLGRSHQKTLRLTEGSRRLKGAVASHPSFQLEHAHAISFL